MVNGGGSWVGEDHQGDALDHLHVSAQAVARLPAEERLRHVRADRWIGYSRATAALERLDTLYAWPGKQRMPNLLLIGPTNNGKSMIIEKFRRLHPPTSHADREQMPVLAVQMPSDPSVIRFYVALLAALGAPLRPRQRLAELEQATLTLLRAVGVRVLVIDELHNLLAGRGETRREFLNLIRFLGNELRIPLVGVGTREAYLAIRSDDQLENRFEPFTLPRWKPNEGARSLLASARNSASPAKPSTGTSHPPANSATTATRSSTVGDARPGPAAYDPGRGAADLHRSQHHVGLVGCRRQAKIKTRGVGL